jgi:hypothetical protein
MSQQQRTTADQTLFYTRIVERYAHFFERPEVRLRFLHRTLAKQASRREQLQERPRLLALLKRFGADDWLLEIELHREILKGAPLLLLLSHAAGLLRRGLSPAALRLLWLLLDGRVVCASRQHLPG